MLTPSPSPDETVDTSHELPYRDELKRKALHLLALVLPLGMAVLDRNVSFLLLLFLCLLALTGDILRTRSASFDRFIRKTFGQMMRPDEQPPQGTAIILNGATWVLIAALLLIILFPPHVAVPSFTMFLISDAAAALVGRRYGRHRWPRSTRTFEGSATFLVTGLLVLLFFPSYPIWIAFLAVSGAALVEALPLPLNDNVRVPLTAALILHLFITAS